MMMSENRISVFLLAISLSMRTGFASHIEYSFNTSAAFFLSFKEDVFKNYNGLANNTDLKYRASLEFKPDLPSWMHCINEQGGNGYLYGVPTETGYFKIEVIATNKLNYDTHYILIGLNIEENLDPARNEVEMRFSNLNVEDMFKRNRFVQIIDIFKRHNLWTAKHSNNLAEPELKNLDTKHDLYVTLVSSAVKMGGRLPPNPKDKEGVVVRVGSSSNLSEELKRLEIEVQPLKKHEPCPKDYKKTSAEWMFRQNGFVPDWCGFRLLREHHVIQKDSGPIHSPILLNSDDFRPPSLSTPPRDLLLDFVLSVVIPIILTLLMLGLLSFFMCCHHEGISDKRNKDNPSIQMVQYASIQRASQNLRALATRREGSRPVGNTPTSTLPRSYGNSPSNTLPKPGSPRKSDEQTHSPPYLSPSANQSLAVKCNG